MKSYSKLIVAVIIVLVVVLLGTNLLFYLNRPSAQSRPYLVDINRAYAEIVQSGDPSAVDVSAYSHLNAISYLPDTATQLERDSFFSGQNTSDIRTFGDGFLRFDYIDDNVSDYVRAQVLANIAIVVVAIICIAVLLYLRSRVIKPLERFTDLPYELAKGHLTSPLKAQKSSYFNKIAWGLDMLRESLEAQKQTELALAKENKSMVLALSHDIKTPLSAIRLYSRALSEQLYEKPDKQRQIAVSIDEKAAQIERLMQDIIKTSKEDFLHLEVENSEFYLSELIEKVQGYYAEKLALIKCDLVVEPYKNLLLFGDIERYMEVMENIIENAIKYGNGHEIRIEFPIDDGRQAIAVTNSGNTLPDGETVHIWSAFWRGSNAKQNDGSGLGLYICRQLMAAMQGEIYAKAEADRMTIVLIPKEA